MRRIAALVIVLTACTHAPNTVAGGVDLASTALGAAEVAAVLAGDECGSRTPEQCEEWRDKVGELVERINEARALVDSSAELAAQIDEARADGTSTK